jgi:hypothetical protein
MTDIHINNHNDLEWVDKAGFTFLQIVVDTDLQLPLSDILAIMKYIQRNAIGTQMGVLLCRMLKEVEHAGCPQPTFKDVEDHFNTSSIPFKKALAHTFNKILQECKQDILDYIEYKKRMDLAQVVESLGKIMKYVGENEISEANTNFIRESLKLIEKGLPSKKE